MGKLVMKRKRCFMSALMPYWIITDISKSKFMERYHLPDDTSCDLDQYFRPIKRMDFNPNQYGVPILNGKVKELVIEESMKSVFAVTLQGLLSNELLLDSVPEVCKIQITTKAGWKHPSYPELTLIT